MSEAWIKDRIKKLRDEGGPLGKMWSEKLETARRQGRLRGVTISTPVDEGGTPQVTRVLKEVTVN